MKLGAPNTPDRKPHTSHSELCTKNRYKPTSVLVSYIQLKPSDTTQAFGSTSKAPTCRRLSITPRESGDPSDLAGKGFRLLSLASNCGSMFGSHVDFECPFGLPELLNSKRFLSGCRLLPAIVQVEVGVRVLA